MSDSSFQFSYPRAGSRRRPLILTLVLTLSAALAGSAWGASSATIGASHNVRLRQEIAVDSHGHTLYVLSPETTHHLLCKSKECLAVWPPLTVSSASKLHNGPGAGGALGVLRRPGGTLQVTLRGLPLYLYSGDRSPGQASGQNLKSFGGTWHVVAP